MIEKGEVMNVIELIQWVADEVCDNYCKYPDEYFRKYKDEDEAFEHLYCEKCEKCCLNKLV